MLWKGFINQTSVINKRLPLNQHILPKICDGTLKGGRKLTLIVILWVFPSKFSTDMHIQKASVFNTIKIEVKIMEVDNIYFQL